MLHAELYKIRTHRTPWVSAAILVVGVLAPSAVVAFSRPGDAAAYSENFLEAFGVLSILTAVAFGGWLLGAEYRQDTAKRMLASEPRRLRALGAKATAGVCWLAAMLAGAALIGWVAARAVGSAHGAAVPWDGRALLASGLTAAVAAALTFGLSAVTRSDTVAIVGSLALIIILDPLLSMVPRLGKYTLGNGVDTIGAHIDGDAAWIGQLSIGAGTAVAVTALWLAVALGVGAALFVRRDA
ncbi:MAG: ABC transporter permease subunit [Microthrixaceae bacterium]